MAGLAIPTLLMSPAEAAAAPSPTTVPGKPPAPEAKRNVATFGTQTSSATKPDSRGIYSFASTPGGRVEDHVALQNYSTQPISLIVRGTDAVNTPQGGFAAKPVNERSTEVGTWVALPTSDLTVTVPARSYRIIPFEIVVPQNATPGDHIGVITATLESAIISPSGQREHLLQTVGSRIFIRVSGPLHPGFTVSGLTVSYQGTADPIGTGLAKLTYEVKNTGNVALGGRQTVYVSGLFGSKKVASRVAEVQLLLPGFSVHQTVTIKGIFPEVLDKGHVSISPLYIPGSAQPISGPYTAAVSFWAVPWTLVAIVVAIIIIIILLLLWRRRRRRRKGVGRKGGKPQPPATSKEPGRKDGQAPPEAGSDKKEPAHPESAPTQADVPAEAEPARAMSQSDSRAEDHT
jgi:hypothetical protein